MKYRNASREHLKFHEEVLAYLLAWTMSKFDSLRRIVVKVGSVAEWVAYAMTLTPSVMIFSRREQLWKLMIASSREHTTKLNDRSSSGICCLEFGVAWGYLTNWWISRENVPISVWHGFDRFTGLPRAWEGNPEGAFCADGMVPQIPDSRVTWHVGDIEQTIDEIDKDPIGRFDQRIVFFDFDLYEPSVVAWNKISNAIRPGDLIYLDEARMKDERTLLNEHILKVCDVSVIGATFNCLALRVTGHKQ